MSSQKCKYMDIRLMCDPWDNVITSLSGCHGSGMVFLLTNSLQMHVTA